MHAPLPVSAHSSQNRAQDYGWDLPGSKNVPWDWLVKEGCYKSPAELKAIFANQQVDIMLPTVISCGSGMTAAVVLLALILLGNKNVKLYDGSWAEWGQDNGLPIETK